MSLPPLVAPSKVGYDKVKKALPLSLIAETSAELAREFAAFDRDGDGTIDADELVDIVKEHKRREQFQKDRAKRFLVLSVVIGVLSVVAFAIMFGVVYGANRASRQTDYNNSNIMLNRNTGEPVKTQTSTPTFTVGGGGTSRRRALGLDMHFLQSLAHATRFETVMHAFHAEDHGLLGDHYMAFVDHHDNEAAAAEEDRQAMSALAKIAEDRSMGRKTLGLRALEVDNVPPVHGSVRRTRLMSLQTSSPDTSMTCIDPTSPDDDVDEDDTTVHVSCQETTSTAVTHDEAQGLLKAGSDNNVKIGSAASLSGSGNSRRARRFASLAADTQVITTSAYNLAATAATSSVSLDGDSAASPATNSNSGGAIFDAPNDPLSGRRSSTARFGGVQVTAQGNVTTGLFVELSPNLDKTVPARPEVEDDTDSDADVAQEDLCDSAPGLSHIPTTNCPSAFQATSFGGLQAPTPVPTRRNLARGLGGFGLYASFGQALANNKYQVMFDGDYGSAPNKAWFAHLAVNQALSMHLCFVHRSCWDDRNYNVSLAVPVSQVTITFARDPPPAPVDASGKKGKYALLAFPSATETSRLALQKFQVQCCVYGAYCRTLATVSNPAQLVYHKIDVPASTPASCTLIIISASQADVGFGARYPIIGIAEIEIFNVGRTLAVPPTVSASSVSGSSSSLTTKTKGKLGGANSNVVGAGKPPNPNPQKIGPTSVTVSLTPDLKTSTLVKTTPKSKIFCAPGTGEVDAVKNKCVPGYCPCAICPTGTWSPFVTDKPCRVAPPGTFAPPSVNTGARRGGATFIVWCQVKTYAKGGAETCLRCPNKAICDPRTGDALTGRIVGTMVTNITTSGGSPPAVIVDTNNGGWPGSSAYMSGFNVAPATPVAVTITLDAGRIVRFIRVWSHSPLGRYGITEHPASATYCNGAPKTWTLTATSSTGAVTTVSGTGNIFCSFVVPVPRTGIIAKQIVFSVTETVVPQNRLVISEIEMLY